MKDIYDEIRVVQKGVLEVNVPINDSTAGIALCNGRNSCACVRAVFGSA